MKKQLLWMQQNEQPLLSLPPLTTLTQIEYDPGAQQNETTQHHTNHMEYLVPSKRGIMLSGKNLNNVRIFSEK